MKIAVLGAGDTGGRHARAWTTLGHDVVSITDLDTSRAEDIAEQCGIRQIYGDFHEAVADPEPQIVSICLPLALHAPATIAAANAGKHVITEKPMCRTFAEADAMQEAVQRN